MTVYTNNIVNGAMVALTQPEIDALVAQQAAAAAVIAAAQPEKDRVSAIDSTIAGDTTIASLKAMNNADFDAWWTANVTSLAQANNVLKRITRVVLRRVL